MSNMSYCRFRNTLLDLRDCYDNLDDDDLSAEEQNARRRLVKMCGDIAHDYMDDDGRTHFDDETPAQADNNSPEVGA